MQEAIPQPPPNTNFVATPAIVMNTLKNTAPVWASIVMHSRDIYLDMVFRVPEGAWGEDLDDFHRSLAAEALTETWSTIANNATHPSLLPEACERFSLLWLCECADVRI